jgi:flagellar hook-associated protein 2
VNAQIGANAGLLSGNSIIRQVRSGMSDLVNYRTGSGAIRSLADLGITLSQSGQMSFDATKLNSLSDSQLADAFKFLGSAKTGFGQLQKGFTQISDPVTGVIKAQLQQYQAADRRITQQISEMTARINIMQATLQSQLQAADALLAKLQSQQDLLTSSITGLNYSTYGSQVFTNK